MKKNTIDTAMLKDIADIETVIEAVGERYVSAGNYVKCLCPFHNDRHIKNAMFNKTTKRFYCYACNTSADLISYTQKQMQMNFQDTCNFIADACGIADDMFKKAKEDPVKKKKRLNAGKFKALRIDGKQKRKYRGENFNASQVPDGAIVNFVQTEEEAQKYRKKGYSYKKCWQEDENGLVYLAGFYIYKKNKMSAARLMMKNPELFVQLMRWKKSELLNILNENKKKVEGTVFDMDEYDLYMMSIDDSKKIISEI